MFDQVIKAFVKDTEFMKRIKNRHYAFWKDPDRERINHTVLTSSDPAARWKEGKNWQRRLSNKYHSREFAKMHGCKVPGLYWKGRNTEEIDPAKLPPYYVVRPTAGHGSNGIWVMKQGLNMFDKRIWSGEEVIEAMRQNLDQHQKLEYLIEEFVRTESGEYKIPVDYKVFTFKGVIACIEVINRTMPKKGTQAFYDENWNRLKPITHTYPEAAYQEPPQCLEEMLHQAKKLSEAFGIFVRVDFYASDQGAVFGEFAATPSLGGRFTSYGSDLLVSYWDKYCTGLI